MGHIGVACYFLLMEICAEKIDKKFDKNLEKSDCEFNFSSRFVRKNLRISQRKLEVFLRICSGLGLFSFEIFEKELKIKFPILLDLLESDQKKTRSRRDQDAIKTRQELELELDKEKELDKELPKTKKPARVEPQTELNRKIWDSFSTAYRKRYGVDPVRNAMTNSQVAKLGRRLGVEALEIVEFYLSHNDSLYLKATHSISLCLRDCESLRTQYVRGKPITGATVRQFEKANEHQENMNLIGNLWGEEKNVV